MAPLGALKHERLASEENDSSHTINHTGIIPSGYRILVEIPEKSDKTQGGIYLPQDAKKQEEIASLVGYVLEVGPNAYEDPSKFGYDNEPWCKAGDYILMAAYSGIRLKIPGTSNEYRLINDDNVCAVVPGPDGVERA